MDNGHNGAARRPIDVRDRNMAALALAEAMERARQGTGLPQKSASVPEAMDAPQRRAMQRLTALRSHLEPLFAAIPADAEGFDLGFVTETNPKLFVDMLSHVDFDAESGAFRFVQETRSGRRVLLETLDEPLLLSKITDHVAERLVARERALEEAETAGGTVPFVAGPPERPRMPDTQPLAVSAARMAESTGHAAPALPAQEKAPAPVNPVAPVAAARPEQVGDDAQEGRKTVRWGWLWPLLAFLVGIAATVLAGYMLIKKQQGL